MKSKITLVLSFVLLSFGAFATNHIINFGGSFGMNYSPNQLNVTVGDTITWMGDFMSHPLESTSVPAGADTFQYHGVLPAHSYVVVVEGAYNFHCTVHLFSGQVVATVFPSSVSQIKPSSEISIYPTSTHNFLKISLPSESKLLVAEVKNILGQTALKSELANGSITTLDLSNLYNGIYFVAIRNDMDVVKVVRIVKE